MLDNPLDFFSAIENGDLIQLSSSLYEFLCRRSHEHSEDGRAYLYHTTEADAVIVWADTANERTTFYARQLYTVLYGRNCLGSIKTTYVGHPTDVTPRPYAFGLTDFEGTLAGLDFLREYRFNNLRPLRKFIQYIESDLRTPVANSQFDFLMHVRPDSYRTAEALTQSKPFVFTEPLPY